MLTDAKLTRLMTWLSPSFPVGAYAYSHGLEHVVEEGEIKGRDDLITWVEGILMFGSGRVDAMFFRAAHTAVAERNFAALAEISEQAAALRGSNELALESAAQGRAFLETVLKIWPSPELLEWREELVASGRAQTYAVGVGAAASIAEIPLTPALTAYLHAVAANLVSAVVRLVPLGQTDGQMAMAALEEVICDAVEAALDRDPDDYGSAALAVDWHSIQHETQYTRIFRS